ncbi:MAG: Uma2 family endonuclease [Chloroflexota bacterium]
MTVAAGILSPFDYLRRERKSEVKNEYFQGNVYQMAGASENHNLIVTNVIATLKNQLRSRRENKCRIYPSDMRVKTETGLYTYPDIVVVCGERQFEGNKRDVLLNPKVIIEVLSPSTKAYDRGKKFEHYRTIPSLTEYILIEQDSHQIEHYVCQYDGTWQLTTSRHVSDSIELPTVGCTLSLVDVYEDVEFDSGGHPKWNGR